ncbi:MAG: T9SS type A sorting domain-containing protein [Bacteroidota bacterium]
MKIFLLSFLLVFVINDTQAQLTITSGAQLFLSGNAQLTLSNMDFVNNGNFSAGSGSVLMNGNALSRIRGGQNTTLYDLTISKSEGGVQLQVPLAVSHQVRFTSGLLDLNANDLNLGGSGALNGEQESSHIIASNGGNVISTVTLAAPSAVNPGNLGIVITSSHNLGNTIIKRGHQSQTSNNGGGNSVLRYYDIIPANNTALDATLRFSYLNDELNGLAENGLVLWQKQTTQKWTTIGFDARNTVSHYVEKNAIASFNRFTLSSLLNALPVRFISFTAHCTGTSVIIEWKTAQEQNSKYYLVQKSADGFAWNTLGRIAAAGNATIETDYHFSDNSAGTREYYRIAEYDADGSSAYTAVLQAGCENQQAFKVWPNPAKDILYINLPAQNNATATIQLFDGKGALIQQQAASLVNGNNLISLPVKALASGIYYISIISTKGTLQVEKFLKQ